MEFAVNQEGEVANSFPMPQGKIICCCFRKGNYKTNNCSLLPNVLLRFDPIYVSLVCILLGPSNQSWMRLQFT